MRRLLISCGIGAVHSSQSFEEECRGKLFKPGRVQVLRSCFFTC
jgi:hypothetical protein